MIFGRKLPKLAETGDSQRTLTILEKGDFGAEKYNESYQSFVEKQHRKEGLEIIEAAHEKFPNDTVSWFHEHWSIVVLHMEVTKRKDLLFYSITLF